MSTIKLQFELEPSVLDIRYKVQSVQVSSVGIRTSAVYNESSKKYIIIKFYRSWIKMSKWLLNGILYIFLSLT